MARNFELFRRFLSIVGLTALILGGLGVGNAVAAYVNDRQRTIATMKALGATGNRVLGHFLVQVMAMTVVGIVLGTLAAGALTLGALPVLGAMMELALHTTIDPRPIFTAAGFGLLIGFLFAYPPLVRALATRPAELFRTLGGTTVRAGRWHYLLQPLFIVPMLLTLLAVLAVALYDTGQPGMVLYYALGVAFAFIVLRAAALLLRGALALLPPPRNVALRSAVRSIRGPASPAAAVILSLGLGMALLLVIAMTEGSLRRQLDPDMRIDAPDFVYLDLFDDEVESFEELARTDPKVKSFTAIPVVRASSFTINGSPPPANVEPPRDISVYFGDERPLSFSSTLPEGSTIASGAWWPPDYTGPPQLSVTDELRESMGLKLGDQITFNIYGETLTTTLTSFRSYDWSRGGVNFPYVLSPGGLDDFPISYFGLLYAAPGAQLPLQRQLVDTHPELVFIPMEEAIDIVRNMVDTIATAISVVGGIALVSGALVIAGALATGRRQREANAVIAKVLGATRGALSGALLIEYALIGALAALVAVALGILGAWLFATHAMGSGFAVDPLLVTAVVLGSLFLTISIGVAMSWTALSARPVAFLRSS
jgi:putative ABC transport system permease protein